MRSLVTVVGGALTSVQTPSELRGRPLIPGLMAMTGYLFVVVAANVASLHWPPVDVAGMLVPAGTLFAGLGLTARDLLHETVSVRGVAAGMVAGVGMSAVFASPEIAVASVVAFTASELIDTLAYARLRHRHRLNAVAVSNAAGLVTDSLLFVPLAFGGFTALPGQIAGKTVATVLTLIALHLGHRRVVRRR